MKVQLPDPRPRPGQASYALAEDQRARVAREVIVLACEAGLTPDSAPVEIGQIAGAHIADVRGAITYRQATRAYARATAHLYFRAMYPTEMCYVGSEGAGADRLDLIWQDETERMWVDALLIDRHLPALRSGRLDELIAHRHRVAGARLGDQYGGLRVCLFNEPARSHVLAADQEIS